jgi:hypothetical protein
MKNDLGPIAIPLHGIRRSKNETFAKRHFIKPQNNKNNALEIPLWGFVPVAENAAMKK